MYQVRPGGRYWGKRATPGPVLRAGCVFSVPLIALPPFPPPFFPQALSMKIKADRDALEATVATAKANLVAGLPPDEDAEREWARREVSCCVRETWRGGLSRSLLFLSVFPFSRERHLRAVVPPSSRYSESGPAPPLIHPPSPPTSPLSPQRERVALGHVAANRAAELDAPASKSTAEARPNAYLGEDMGLPKPYGAYAPFKPTDAGVSGTRPWEAPGRGGFLAVGDPRAFFPSPSRSSFPPTPTFLRSRPQCGISESRTLRRFCCRAAGAFRASRLPGNALSCNSLALACRTSASRRGGRDCAANLRSICSGWRDALFYNPCF